MLRISVILTLAAILIAGYVVGCGPATQTDDGLQDEWDQIGKHLYRWTDTTYYNGVVACYLYYNPLITGTELSCVRIE